MTDNGLKSRAGRALPRSKTPLPESRQRSTQGGARPPQATKGSEATWIDGQEHPSTQRDVSVIDEHRSRSSYPTLAPAQGMSQEVDESLEAVIPGPFSSSFPEGAAPYSSSWSSVNRSGGLEHHSGAGGAYGRSKEPLSGAGYYSIQSDSEQSSTLAHNRAENVSIPPPPLLPELDLISVEEEGWTPRRNFAERQAQHRAGDSKIHHGARGGERSSVVPPSMPKYDEDAMDTIACPPPRDEQATVDSQFSTHPEYIAPNPSAAFATPRGSVPSRSAHGATGPLSIDRESSRFRKSASISGGTSRRESGVRIVFSVHLATQATLWLETGSLSLPDSASSRFARATQRALLLAMLEEPGWDALPHGLKQRAGWLFCRGWESDSGSGHPYREEDDLASVLGMECSPQTRQALRLFIERIVPRNASSRPPRRSEPPGR